MGIKKWLVLFILAAVSITACSDSNIKKLSNGVTIKLKKQRVTDPNMIRIQVCAQDIIRVTASPTRTFSSRPSLMLKQNNWPEVPFIVQERNNAILISTSKITAEVSTLTGEVSFFDHSGRPILQEKSGGGKIFNPADVMDEKTWHIQQIFNSQADEAFYGLGQHQNNIMNFKGQDVDLQQYNIIVAIPFLISSRNYAILWDNNSRTKFGDKRDYQAISSLTLYDKEGRKGGLTAEYFRSSDFSDPLMSRTESVIAHENLEETGGYPQGFNVNNGSVRWSGEIEADQTGVYKIRLYSSSYAKMWINDELAVNCWRQNWLPWTHIIQLSMKAAQRCPIKIEWIPSGGYIGLRCLSPEEQDNKDKLSLYSEVADQIDYYFIYGGNIDQLIRGYRQITGRAPMTPKWAMGLWQCRERYKTQEELLSVVKEFRKRQIPLDNIVQDWFYWEENKWGDHDFDPQRYPDPTGMVKQLHDELHCRIMISVWPKFYVGTENYNQFKEKGWLYMRNIEKQQRDWVGPGYVSTFYDPYSKDARELFWKQIENKLFSRDFDAWWLDATEPDIHSNLAETERILRMGPTALGSASRYLNTYSLMNCKSIYEGQLKAASDRRVFILTRSAFAGQQRYSAATWSGDIATRWYDLKAQIPAGLNFCLSGIPYWTMDIGGFSVEPRFERATGEDLEEWRELNTRWFQFGTFCPIFRVHGQFPFREMFHIAPDSHPAYRAMLAYDRLRYRLMPYIYSLAGMVTHNDYTIMRALVMDFGHNKNVYNIGDQFMFGPALLINPVTEYKVRSRFVYLPAGADWFDLKTGKFFPGGQTINADAPYSDIPIFVRAGSILPFGPAIQYTAEKRANPIRLFIYAGANGSFTLYEDENVNNNYEKGAYSLIPLTYDEGTGTLTIGARQGRFAGMLNERTFEVVWVDANTPKRLDLEQVPNLSLSYDGNELEIKRSSPPVKEAR